MSLTKLSLGGKKTKLFPPRKSLISDIPAGDGKTANSFLQCNPSLKTSLDATIWRFKNFKALKILVWNSCLIIFYLKGFGNILFWKIKSIRPFNILIFRTSCQYMRIRKNSPYFVFEYIRKQSSPNFDFCFCLRFLGPQYKKQTKTFEQSIAWSHCFVL